jgi:hypothetical protein
MLKKIVSSLLMLFILSSCSFIDETFSTKLDYSNYATYYDIEIKTRETALFYDLSPTNRFLSKGISIEINITGATSDYEFHEAEITLLLTNSYEAFNFEDQAPTAKRFSQYVTIRPNISGNHTATRNYVISEISDGFKYLKNITDRKYQVIGVSGYLKKR